MPNDETNDEQHVYVVAESADGMRIGMSVETYKDHYANRDYRVVAGVGADGKEHPHAKVVKELNTVQKSTTATETNETGDGGTTTKNDADGASRTATSENTD